MVLWPFSGISSGIEVALSWDPPFPNGTVLNGIVALFLGFRVVLRSFFLGFEVVFRDSCRDRP